MTLDKLKIDIKTNNSSLYFLPFLDELVKFKALDLIKNTYLCNNETDREFCILYKFSAKLEFIKFEEELLTHELCTGHEDYDEYVLYKFRIPDTIMPLFNNVVQSRFTYTSDEQRQIVRLARRRLLPGIDLLKQRLEGKFKIAPTNLEEETFSTRVSRLEVKTATDLYLQAKG